MDELDVLREINFDWTMHVKGIWTDSRFSSPKLNKTFRDEILGDFNRLANSKEEFSSLGRVILGPAGAGKTHFIGELRREIFKRSAGFVLVDMTDVNDFMETVVLGYLGSLGESFPNGKTQSQVIFHHLLGMLNVTLDKKRLSLEQLVKKIPSLSKKQEQQLRDKLITLLRQKYPRQAGPPFQDVIRAFLLFNAQDFREKDLGYLWLQGQSIDETDKKAHGFNLAKGKHSDIIKGLSWLMNLKFPVLLALDQFDAIVAEQSLKCSGKGDARVSDLASNEEKKSLAIIEKIAGGLMALRDMTARTITVAACLEATWEFLRSRALKSSMDRFKTPNLLGPISKADIAEKIIGSRLADSYGRIKFTPPYPTWPIKPAAFDTAKELFPREILKRCDNYRQHCLNTKTIVELESFEEMVSLKHTGGESPGIRGKLGGIFKKFYDLAPVRDIINEDNEDDILKNLVQTACRCLVKETGVSDSVDVLIDTRFQGGTSYRTLHARVCIIYRDQGDRERHFCIRGLQKNNSRSFQARLRAAMTESGMDSGFAFRHLMLLRQGEIPSGEKTLELLDAFKRSGGTMEHLSQEAIRSLWALFEMEKLKDPDFESWLFMEKIVSSLGYFQLLLAWLTREEGKKKDESSIPDSKPGLIADKQPGLKDNRHGQSKVSISAPTNDEKPTMSQANERNQPESSRFLGDLPVGVRIIGQELAEEISIPIQSLTNHTVILAGSGAGKTVLVKRLVEEAAIKAIPSIVIDCANDLARLSDPWPKKSGPEKPDEWNPRDTLASDAYHAKADVVIWTPGREKGNPLVCEYLPDISALYGDPDELNQAVRMVWSSLKEIVAPGNSAGAKKKSGVLSSALDYYTVNGWKDLNGFINLLSDLPQEAGGDITRSDKLGQEMADSLKARVQTDPMLGQTGTPLDPSVLFGLDNPSGKTRISVLSLVGLSDLESQQQFINQLAMNLFAWIKKNPAPIRGLLVIDEAKDFIPSMRSTLCSKSILRLCAQARKYGLGLVFATQEPKSIDHNVISNCFTQFYGRVNSIAAIEAVKQQIQQRGGHGKDVSTLVKGNFYISTEKIKPPVKIKVPLCLSHHPANPLKEEEILQRGRGSRKKLLK